VVLNQYFGLDEELMPPRSYHSPYNNLLEFTDITDRLNK
jgi:hypothetical protein